MKCFDENDRKFIKSNTYNICLYEACVKFFITLVADFSGFWLLICGHNRRGTERSKLRIFEIDLLIIWYQTPGKSIYSFHPKFFCPNITLGYKTKPYGTTYGTSYQRSSLLCGPLWEQYNIELNHRDLNLSDYFFTSPRITMDAAYISKAIPRYLLRLSWVSPIWLLEKILKWAMKPGCKAGKLYLWRNLPQWLDFGQCRRKNRECSYMRWFKRS